MNDVWFYITVGALMLISVVLKEIGLLQSAQIPAVFFAGVLVGALLWHKLVIEKNKDSDNKSR
jgi:hypothetical protein